MIKNFFICPKKKIRVEVNSGIVILGMSALASATAVTCKLIDARYRTPTEAEKIVHKKMIDDL